MGIYGLLQTMKTVVHGGCEPVSLSEIAVKYRNEMKKDPVILVDSSCCGPTFGAPCIEDANCLKENLETFVNNCFQINIRLIFVGCGMKSPDKYKKWAAKYCCHSTIAETDTLHRNFYIGFNLNTMTEVLLSEPLIQKCKFVRSLFDSYEYITNYAKTRGCFAILSNNSNYLMVEGAAYFLSITDLDVHSLTTRNFNRNMLAKHLKVSPSELSVFGSLLPPSYPQQYIRSYHKGRELLEKEFRETVKLMQTFPKAEEIVRDMSLIDGLEGVSEEKRLLFKKQFVSFTASRPTKGIKPTGFENWDRILRLAEKRHVEGVANRKILEILVNRVIFLMPKLFTPGVATEESLLPIRKIIYGIILLECPDTNLAVVEYPSSNEVPVLHRRAHCGLLKLWSNTNSDKILYLKRELFCQALSDKLSPEVLEELDLPEELLFPVLAISYWSANFKEKPKRFEVNALLLQIVLARKFASAKAASSAIKFVPSMLRPVDIYLTILEYLSLLNSACGEPFCRSKTNLRNCFNGVIYDAVYRKLRQQPELSTSYWEGDKQEEVTVLKKALKKLKSVYNGDCRDGASDAVEVAAQNIKDLNI